METAALDPVVSFAAKAFNLIKRDIAVNEVRPESRHRIPFTNNESYSVAIEPKTYYWGIILPDLYKKILEIPEAAPAAESIVTAGSIPIPPMSRAFFISL